LGGILPPSKFYQYFWQRVSDTFHSSSGLFSKKKCLTAKGKKTGKETDSIPETNIIVYRVKGIV
jgi:hypothetical protein